MCIVCVSTRTNSWINLLKWNHNSHYYTSFQWSQGSCVKESGLLAFPIKARIFAHRCDIWSSIIHWGVGPSRAPLITLSDKAPINKSMSSYTHLIASTKNTKCVLRTMRMFNRPVYLIYLNHTYNFHFNYFLNSVYQIVQQRSSIDHLRIKHRYHLNLFLLNANLCSKLSRHYFQIKGCRNWISLSRFPIQFELK